MANVTGDVAVLSLVLLVMAQTITELRKSIDEDLEVAPIVLLVMVLVLMWLAACHVYHIIGIL